MQLCFSSLNNPPKPLPLKAPNQLEKTLHSNTEQILSKLLKLVMTIIKSIHRSGHVKKQTFERYFRK